MTLTLQKPEAKAEPSVLAPELPTPPNDFELWWYLGRQRREVQIAMSLSFVIASVSMIQFSRNSPWLFIFYILLGINIVSSVLHLFTGFNGRKISRRSHEQTVAAWKARPEQAFADVDVYLPVCAEDIAVLRNTFYYTSKMEWGGNLKVWVLDDADQPEVKVLAEEFGFEYIVRANRGEMKKAGNLKNAFNETTAEFIVIFDADFCPRVDFLEHTVPYMANEKVGIVQTPQFFDVKPHMGWLERTAGATQELFYRWVQPSRDRLGGAVCVGSCALYRRSALEAIGGFAQIEHSEDVHTGLALMRAGFETKYVPILVSRGLCPDDLSGFLNQQYRWANGSMTSLKSGSAQIFPLSVWQAACFWSGFTYYISTAVNVLLLHFPIVYLLVFDPTAIRASYVLYFLPGFFTYFVLIPRASRLPWRFEVMRVQIAYSLAHALSIWHKILGVTAGWVPTGVVGKKNPLARTIAKVGITVLSINVLVPALAMSYDIAAYGWKEYWATAAVLMTYTYLAVPLVWGFITLLNPKVSLPTLLRRKPKQKPQRAPNKSGQISLLRAFLTTSGIVAFGFFATVGFDAPIAFLGNFIFHS